MDERFRNYAVVELNAVRRRGRVFVRSGPVVVEMTIRNRCREQRCEQCFPI